jgi:hypothetical protein
LRGLTARGCEKVDRHLCLWFAVAFLSVIPAGNLLLLREPATRLPETVVPDRETDSRVPKRDLRPPGMRFCGEVPPP